MRLCFLLETREPLRPNRVILEAVSDLEARGAKVDMVYPECMLWRLDTLKPEADLYLLKSDSELALSLAHSLELVGGRVLNPYDACRKAKDKTLAAALLARAGVPAPASFAAGHTSQLRPRLSHGSLILKPNRGYHGVGLSIVADGPALDRAPDYPEAVFAQHYLADARKDLKLFGIGEEVFAVRKPFSADSFMHAGTPAPLAPEHEAIARRCARAFGLSLYGLDLVEQDGEASVVDVNYFPGYRGVPDAARRIADLVWRTARGRA